MRNKGTTVLLLLLTAIVIYGCSATRYVPQGSYLLRRNIVDVKHETGITKKEVLTADQIAQYIKQRPNRRVLGVGLSLGLYNMTDTAKHNKWHKLWSEKFGEPPVILDTTMTQESNREMQIYLASRGYLNAKVTDSITTKDRKATVHYNVNRKKPYTISYIDYNIEDPFIGELVIQDTTHSLLKKGEIFDRETFQNERTRITNSLRNMGFYYFGNSSITYSADSTWGDNTVSVQVNIKRRVASYGAGGKPIYTNHPIYRISRIMINTDFNPLNSIEENQVMHNDTIIHNGVEIIYSGKLQMKPEVLIAALRFSPNSLYDQNSVQRSNTNIRDLGYTTTVLFTPVAQDSTKKTVVTIPTTDGTLVSTTEQQLECLIQCTPLNKQSITEELELSTTAAYSSVALTLGYQNRNLLGGAENFVVSLRGAFELRKGEGTKNSYEVGVTTSLALPRFLLPWQPTLQSKVRQSSTKLQLSYNIQERPDYHRTIFGGAYGYGWTTKKGSRISLNPIDINIVNVPWVDSTFLSDMDNPYLENSYKSQMIAGLSMSYFYNSTPKFQNSGYTIRISSDLNGNFISLFNNLITRQQELDGEKFHTLLGLRYSQYARASFEYSQRHNITNNIQIAWRVFAGAGIPYGNSSILPFERLYFAGGSNSMRGWQIRTLGPGSAAQSESAYPNQQGDMRLEANFEFRHKIWGGLNGAIFFDGGNIWMNSKGRKSNDELFQFNSFYKQLALNTGAGLRWDFDIFLIRLDWGLKLRSPYLPHGQQWFKEMGFSDSVFHFAIGLPF